ncbi:MAG: LptF/LptG family permease [candidate division KSB1 bacterium]|nr:LptF/LptG family permease [candidate division KSB1 bacterium]
MLILPRYIVREHIGPFVFSFFVITLFFLLNILFRELGRLLSRGLEFRVIVEYFALHMGWILALTIPMAVLPAVLMAFGRLSSDNEIVAIKASGVSLYRITAPVLVAAGALCVFCIWFGNSILPDMNHRARLLTGDIARKRPTLTLEPGVVFEVSPTLHLSARAIKESEGYSKLWGVVVDDYSEPDVTQTVFADSGEIHVDRTQGALTLDLYHGRIEKVDFRKLGEYVHVYFPHLRVTPEVPGLVLSRSQSEYRGDREKSARTMLREVKQKRELIAAQEDRIRQALSAPHGDKLSSLLGGKKPSQLRAQDIERVLRTRDPGTREKGDLPGLSQMEVRTLTAIRDALLNIESLERSISKLMVEVHKKYSIPVACVVFVLIGAPLGIMAHRGSWAVGGGISLFFFLLYWALLIGGEELADRRIISPFWAMWSADILVGAAGIALLMRSARETILIDFAKLRTIFKKGAP